VSDWRHRARCRDVDPDLFFPTGTSAPADRRQAEQAKAVCALCPVRSECLAWSLDTFQDSGIWGGLTEEERRALRRQGRTLARDRCGTVARYDLTGCRCDRCEKAKASANRRKRIRRAS
jgi:WhiB family transcriptional regulator, redox-sensing transcriptional regulator